MSRQVREHSYLKIDLKLAAYRSTEAVEELAELRACDVILHISGIEVVGGIKNSQADSGSSSSNARDKLWYGESFRNL